MMSENGQLFVAVMPCWARRGDARRFHTLRGGTSPQKWCGRAMQFKSRLCDALSGDASTRSLQRGGRSLLGWARRGVARLGGAVLGQAVRGSTHCAVYHPRKSGALQRGARRVCAGCGRERQTHCRSRSAGVCSECAARSFDASHVRCAANTQPTQKSGLQFAMRCSGGARHCHAERCRARRGTTPPGRKLPGSFPIK